MTIPQNENLNKDLSVYFSFTEFALFTPINYAYSSQFYILANMKLTYKLMYKIHSRKKKVAEYILFRDLVDVFNAQKTYCNFLQMYVNFSILKSNFR